MRTSVNELQKRIKVGEDSYLELKEIRISNGKLSGPQQIDLADELAAFANTQGGELILGVNDKNREITGIPMEFLDDVENLVFQACEDTISPPITPLTERLTLLSSTDEERIVIRVAIERSSTLHQSSGKYWHRQGSSKRITSTSRLAHLFKSRLQAQSNSYDEIPVLKASLGELDDKLWKRFQSPRSTGAPERFLSKLAMASVDENEIWRPTVTGLLMACKNPGKILPNAFIQAVAYRGNSINPLKLNKYQRDSRDITGTLDKQILDAYDFVLKNMRYMARKHSDGGREDIPQFDHLAVFEAITNAVVHRDYNIAGSHIRLRLFDDQLELFSPGGLPNTMTIDSMSERQFSRNQALTSLLSRCSIDRDEFEGYRKTFMDKRGEGVQIILSRSELLSGKRPSYRLIDESELLLTIYAAPDD